MKILINGKRNRKMERSFDGKFASKSWFKRIWNSIKWFWERVLWGSIALIVLCSIYIQGTLDQVQAEQVNTLEVKIEQLKSEVVDEIANRENRGNVPSIPDDNKAHNLPLKDKVSSGCLMMKVSTVQRFQFERTKEKLTDIEAMQLALDCNRAKDLSKFAIFEKNHVGEWSVADAGIKAKVAIINKLEK